jgi:hypothetical protein
MEENRSARIIDSATGTPSPAPAVLMYSLMDHLVLFSWFANNERQVHQFLWLLLVTEFLLDY